jgi:hypothetical protein
MRDGVHIFNGVAVTLQLVNDEIDIYHIGLLEDARLGGSCFAERHNLNGVAKADREIRRFMIPAISTIMWIEVMTGAADEGEGVRAEGVSGELSVFADYAGSGGARRRE